ncbi:MAG: 1-acyl-sn-glycerol-3-phosphate acyltransferase [Promethearchaeota archaeon]
MSADPFKRILQMSDEFFIPFLKMAETVGFSSTLQKSTWQASNRFITRLLRSLFNLTIEGRGNIPESGAGIICARNTSGIYPFIAWVTTYQSNERRVFQAFDNEYFEIPILRSLLYYNYAFSITNGILDDHTRDLIIEKLLEGELVGLTLENMKKNNGDSTTIKNLDLINIAIQEKVPIIPIIVPNAQNVLDLKNGKFSFNQKIKVKILKPMMVQDSENPENIHSELVKTFNEEEKKML